MPTVTNICRQYRPLNLLCIRFAIRAIRTLHETSLPGFPPEKAKVFFRRFCQLSFAPGAPASSNLYPTPHTVFSAHWLLFSRRPQASGALSFTNLPEMNSGRFKGPGPLDAAFAAPGPSSPETSALLCPGAPASSNLYPAPHRFQRPLVADVFDLPAAA